jgi:hypothetical protein
LKTPPKNNAKRFKNYPYFDKSVWAFESNLEWLSKFETICKNFPEMSSVQMQQKSILSSPAIFP